MAVTYNPLTNPNAVDMLQKHFPDFYFNLGLTRVCFFHHITETPCGGDEVNPVPFAFAIFNQDFVECALFVRVSGVIAFYGVFNTPFEALEFLIDHFDIEVYFGNECQIENLIANIPSASPLDADEDHICLYDGNPCEKPCDEWNNNGCWCGRTHFPENLPTTSVDN